MNWSMLPGAVSAHSTEPDDNVAPPIAMCATCGLTSCPGCVVVHAEASSVAWEDQRQVWWRRLWRTSLASSLEPQRFFGELPRGSVREALAFALCAELCAHGSLLVLAALVLWGCAPELLSVLLADAGACGTLALAWLAFVAWMLVMHVVWGLCLAWGARSLSLPARGGLASRWQSGVRFGLYACGWDLLTSPIGVVAALCTRGPRRAWAPVGAAARAPARAQRAYLELRLGADEDSQRRARRLVFLALGVGMLVVLLMGAAVVVLLARRFGY